MSSTKPKELKKRKLPKLFVDSEGGWNGIGRYKCRDVNGTLFVTWCAEGGETREESFLDLCNKPELSEHRKELGTIVAGVVQQASEQALRSSPDINEAMRYSNMLDREASLWRHWSIVPAGHMLFPEPKTSAKRNSKV